ncbi:MAG: SDR family NAD(P)-dependent oxidoreductase [Acidobacteriaceae bacterium]|jgi:NAD(P)-dependent dehydrogenase (short-subunit alcohol dehydrogenase family)
MVKTAQRRERGPPYHHYAMSSTGSFATYPSLRDRVVIVTGGASGIGAAIVEAFATNGARVAFLDVQIEAAHQLVARLEATGAPAPLFLPCDLTDIAALQNALRAIIVQFGTVDVLVNNAGDDTRHSVAEVTPESWDRGIAVNLKHQFFMAQGVIPAMQKAGRGSIINMSSIGWVIPSTHVPVYVTAKAAIVGMTRTLAHELGPSNIRVNCVMPGAILTERQRRLWLTPEYEAKILAAQALKRLILPEEVARLVLFLAADDSSAITNQSYVIDGGWV